MSLLGHFSLLSTRFCLFHPGLKTDISLASLLWHSLEAVFCSFPPVYSQAFFNCWLSLWASRTSQHFFYVYMLPCVVPRSGRQVNAPASLCCSPASAPTPPPLMSLPFLLLSDSLDLGALWTGFTWIPGPWHQSSMDLPDFPSLATCFEPPLLSFPVCCASCQLLLLSQPQLAPQTSLLALSH